MAFLKPIKEGAHINNFRAAVSSVEQMFVKPVNAGQKPGHQLRMWQQSEPSVIFHAFCQHQWHRQL